ncbi:MAG: hypothetical protein H7841_14710 [Magnetospirillum sp. WYHS-4]
MTKNGSLDTTWNELRRLWLEGREQAPAILRDIKEPIRFRSPRARRAAAHRQTLAIVAIG